MTLDSLAYLVEYIYLVLGVLGLSFVIYVLIATRLREPRCWVTIAGDAMVVIFLIILQRAVWMTAVSRLG